MRRDGKKAREESKCVSVGFLALRPQLSCLILNGSHKSAFEPLSLSNHREDNRQKVVCTFHNHKIGGEMGGGGRYETENGNRKTSVLR